MVWLFVPWTVVFLAACAAVKGLSLPDTIESAEVTACRDVGARRDTEVCTRVEAGKRPTISGRTVWRP